MTIAEAITQKHSQSNEAREPKQHRDRLDGEDGKRVVRARVGEARRDYDKVDEGEECPD